MRFNSDPEAIEVVHKMLEFAPLVLQLSEQHLGPAAAYTIFPIGSQLPEGHASHVMAEKMSTLSIKTVS